MNSRIPRLYTEEELGAFVGAQLVAHFRHAVKEFTNGRMAPLLVPPLPVPVGQTEAWGKIADQIERELVRRLDPRDSREEE